MGKRAPVRGSSNSEAELTHSGDVGKGVWLTDRKVLFGSRIRGKFRRALLSLRGEIQSYSLLIVLILILCLTILPPAPAPYMSPTNNGY